MNRIAALGLPESYLTTLAEANYDAGRIPVIDRLIARVYHEKKAQCVSYILSRNGKAFYCDASGKLTYEEDSPEMQVTSIRGIASVTKVFVAVAILKLIEDGVLELSQHVAGLLPEFNTPMHGSITIFQLLTHTSGIRGDVGSYFEPYPGFTKMYEDSDNDNWLKQVLAGPLESKPGTQASYCSSGFNILCEVITKATGVHYEQYIHDNILAPLDMQDTFFDVPEEKKSRICYTNQWEKEHCQNSGTRTSTRPRGSGGLYSTLADLYKFGSMLVNRGELNGVRILGRIAVENMCRNHLVNIPYISWGSTEKDMKYGLGLPLNTNCLVSDCTYEHEGSGRCALVMDMKERFVAAYFMPLICEFCPEACVHMKNVIWSGIK